MPDFILETEARSKGFAAIAGIDEAGRGPLAGPVVAAAVILDPENLPAGLNDSKKLTARKRERVFEEICTTAHIGIASAPPEIIERRNIRGATLWAMVQAFQSLPVVGDFALIDGRDVPPGLPCPADYVIGGDARSLSIAAASIVAKVARDMMCPVLEEACPGYGFAAHKGYGTAQHLDALRSLGATVHHRADFAPVAQVLQSLNPVT